MTVSAIDEQIAAAIRAGPAGGCAGRFFGALAVVLAALGLYGITAYSVARRQMEIACALALGAHGRVVRLVLSRVALLLGAGVVVGVVASLWASTLSPAPLRIEPRPGEPRMGRGDSRRRRRVGGLAAGVARLPYGSCGSAAKQLTTRVRA